MRRLLSPFVNWQFVSGFLAASSLYTLYTLLNLPPPPSSPANPPTNALSPSPSSTSSRRRKRMLFFGDSITQHGWNAEINGWVSAIAHHWFRRVDIHNRGFSGYNSRWGRALVKEVVVEEGPDLVTVFFGANDAVDESVLQHVPLPEYEENLRTILHSVTQVDSP